MCFGGTYLFPDSLYIIRTELKLCELIKAVGVQRRLCEFQIDAACHVLKMKNIVTTFQSPRYLNVCPLKEQTEPC